MENIDNLLKELDKLDDQILDALHDQILNPDNKIDAFSDYQMGRRDGLYRAHDILGKFIIDLEVQKAAERFKKLDKDGDKDV